MKVNTEWIMKTIGVSPTQVEMAIYSGRLPEPDKHCEWYLPDIEYIIQRWGSSLITKRNLKKFDNIPSGKLEFPKHTR